MMTEKEAKTREAIAAYLFIFPVLSKLIFPASIEAIFSFMLFDYFPCYFFDIFYIIYPFLAKKQPLHGAIRVASYILVLQFIFVVCGVFLNDYSDRYLLLWGNNYYFPALFFALNYPFTPYQIHLIKKPLLFCFLFLVIQIILLSTGVVSYSPDIVDAEYAGMARVATSIGAPNGTSVAMFLLGGLVFYLYEKSSLKYPILFFWATGVFLTVSRAASIAVVVSYIYFLYKEIYNSKKKAKTSFILILASVVILFALFKTGYIAPLLERTTGINDSGADVTSGRTTIFQVALKLAYIHPIWGVGFGNVYCTTSLSSAAYTSAYNFAPHNLFILTLVEQGIVGFVLFVAFYLTVLTHISYNKNILSIVLLLTTLVLFNAETIIINCEYMYLISMVINISMNKPEEYVPEEENYESPEIITE